MPGKNTGRRGNTAFVQAMPYIKDIIGIGLARGIPNWKGGRASHTSFAPIFKKCKDMGLHLTAHAGMYTSNNNNNDNNFQLVMSYASAGQFLSLQSSLSCCTLQGLLIRHIMGLHLSACTSTDLHRPFHQLVTIPGQPGMILGFSLH